MKRWPFSSKMVIMWTVFLFSAMKGAFWHQHYWRLLTWESCILNCQTLTRFQLLIGKGSWQMQSLWTCVTFLLSYQSFFTWQKLKWKLCNLCFHSVDSWLQCYNVFVWWISFTRKVLNNLTKTWMRLHLMHQSFKGYKTGECCCYILWLRI